jgi:hypothetical protein
MKKYLFLLSIPFLLFSSFTTAILDRCACGDYYTSIITYNVGEGQDCCKGKAVAESGYEAFYEPQGGGVFKWVKLFSMNGTDAQNSCCY